MTEENATSFQDDVCDYDDKKTLLMVATENCAKTGKELPIENFENYLKTKRESVPKSQKNKNSNSSSNDESVDDCGCKEYYESQKNKKGREFKVSSHNDPVPREGCSFDVKSNLELWEHLMANSFMGTGLLKKAAVFNRKTGGVYACSPPDFMPTQQQVKLLSAALEKPGIIAKDGIEIADSIYTYEMAEHGVSITGKSANDYFFLRVGNESAMAVVFEKTLRDEALKLVDELHKYFCEVYNF